MPAEIVCGSFYAVSWVLFCYGLFCFNFRVGQARSTALQTSVTIGPITPYRFTSPVFSVSSKNTVRFKIFRWLHNGGYDSFKPDTSQALGEPIYEELHATQYYITV